MGLPLTPSQTVGPYFSFSLCRGLIGPELVSADAPGAIRIEGRVLDGAGDPVPDAMVEIWQADAAGRYAGTAAGFPGLGRCGTDEHGRFAFVTAKPGPVPAPGGGVQAPHVDVSVFARGLLKRLVTRIYFPDEEGANAADPVLASVPGETARATLVAQPEDGMLRFDIRLQGDGQTTFFAV